MRVSSRPVKLLDNENSCKLSLQSGCAAILRHNLGRCFGEHSAERPFNLHDNPGALFLNRRWI
jgi:hypothetical protein